MKSFRFTSAFEISVILSPVKPDQRSFTSKNVWCLANVCQTSGTTVTSCLIIFKMFTPCSFVSINYLSFRCVKVPPSIKKVTKYNYCQFFWFIVESCNFLHKFHQRNLIEIIQAKSVYTENWYDSPTRTKLVSDQGP